MILWWENQHEFLITEMIFWYQKLMFDIKNDFLISEICADSLILQNHFLISENQFLVSENYFWFISDIRKSNFWYQKVSTNFRYQKIISDIRKWDDFISTNLRFYSAFSLKCLSNNRFQSDKEFSFKFFLKTKKAAHAQLVHFSLRFQHGYSLWEFGRWKSIAIGEFRSHRAP